MATAWQADAFQTDPLAFQIDTGPVVAAPWRFAPLAWSFGTTTPLPWSAPTSPLPWSLLTSPVLLWGVPVAVYTPLEVFVGEKWTYNARPAPKGANDITGWSLAFSVYDGATVIITKTVGSGITVVSALYGLFDVTLTAADLTLTPGDYTYDLRRTDSGAEGVLAFGPLAVLASH